jgi:predicted PurR-regulated permease PerM
MFHSKYFRFAIWVIVVFLIILLATQITFIFRPLVVLIQTFFFPVLLAGLLYFILVPLVQLLSRFKIPKSVSIILIYVSVGGVIAILSALIGPLLNQQVKDLGEKLPTFVSELQEKLVTFQEYPWFERIVQTDSYSPEAIAARFSNYFGDTVKMLGNNIMKVTFLITNIILALVLVPFLLFYMLKDGDKLPVLFTKFIPESHKKDALNILGDMHSVLGQYIKGQLTVSLFVGILLYIGFLIVGLDYALLLAFIALITNIVPFIGPIIGTIPALIIAIIDSPFMAIYTLILIFVVQQIESLYISPKVMGNKLAIHPIIILLIVIFAGKFAGLIGVIIAIPTFAIGRVILIHTIRLLELRKKIKNYKQSTQSKRIRYKG